MTNTRGRHSWDPTPNPTGPAHDDAARQQLLTLAITHQCRRRGRQRQLADVAAYLAARGGQVAAVTITNP